MNLYLYQISDGNPNETPIYVNPKSKNGLLPPRESLRTIHEQLLESFNSFQNKQSLGIINQNTKNFDYISYKEIQEISTAIGSSLCMEEYIQEINDQQGNTIKPVGIYMSNGREWTFADLGCILYGFTTCPFYETLGPDNLQASMNYTQIRLCFVDKNTAQFIAQSEIPELKTVVTIDELDEETINKLKNKNIKIISFNQFLIRGRANLKPYPQITLDTPFTIVFTSGSTGVPKAVVWKHLNFACQLVSTFTSDEQLALREDDRIIIHRPMPHTAEKLLDIQAILKGAQINYSSKDPSLLFHEMRICRPTYISTVPQINNIIYDEIQNWLHQQPPNIRAELADAVEQKIQFNKVTEESNNLFQQIQAIIGGKLRILLSFAAPISEKILDFLRATFCCIVCELYGQTEIGCALLPSTDDKISGHVGGPSISHELKFVSVPEMNYYTDAKINGKVRGEIYMRGLSVINGYWANPIYTAETFDQEGWIRTGDIGEIVDGAVRIIDRKNHLFKSSKGMWVSPQIIENILRKLNGISDIAIFGDSLKYFPVAIVVPEPIFLKEIAQELKIEGDHQTLCNNVIIRKTILEKLRKQCNESQVNDYETIRNLYLEPHQFKDLGIVTGTLKLQRHKAKALYQNIIQKLYEELEQDA